MPFRYNSARSSPIQNYTLSLWIIIIGGWFVWSSQWAYVYHFLRINPDTVNLRYWLSFSPRCCNIISPQTGECVAVSGWCTKSPASCDFWHSWINCSAISIFHFGAKTDLMQWLLNTKRVIEKGTTNWQQDVWDDVSLSRQDDVLYEPERWVGSRWRGDCWGSGVGTTRHKLFQRAVLSNL